MITFKDRMGRVIDPKSLMNTIPLRYCEHLENEIDSLNAQLALLRKVISDEFDDFEKDRTHPIDCLKNITCAAVANAHDWLAEHDKFVRNQALEDAASVCENCGYDSIGGALDIRAMKVSP